MDDDGTVVTIERETEETTVETPTAPNKPDVPTFRSIIQRHLDQWGVVTVGKLCVPQTQALIDELATYFV